MARPLRIEYPGAWYHVMNRGAAGQPIFATDRQRKYFLSLLADTAGRFNAEWHAYCLMGNHYHLLLRTPDGNLQRIMRQINGVYTQHYNRTSERDGALFRGRYKAVLVDAQSYWLQLSRYIHRNPIEAGLVTRLEDYPWSSYPAYIGVAEAPGWLTSRYVLKAIAVRNSEARYRAYVAAGTDAELASFYAAGPRSPVLGSDEFKGTLRSDARTVDTPELKQARTRPTADRIVSAVAARMNVDHQIIWTSSRGRHGANPARGMAMYLCQQEADMRLHEIADRFGLRHYASASSSIRLFRRRLADDRQLQALLNLVLPDLSPDG